MLANMDSQKMAGGESILGGEMRKILEAKNPRMKNDHFSLPMILEFRF